jgi:molybdopterin biosynthesis enzyme
VALPNPGLSYDDRVTIRPNKRWLAKRKKELLAQLKGSANSSAETFWLQAELHKVEDVIRIMSVPDEAKELKRAFRQQKPSAEMEIMVFGGPSAGKSGYINTKYAGVAKKKASTKG